jgi:hypothetical protein
VLGGDGGYRPAGRPGRRRDGPGRCAGRRRSGPRIGRRWREAERLRAAGIVSYAAIARALTGRGVPAPSGRGAWTHTTVARVQARAGAGSA